MNYRGMDNSRNQMARPKLRGMYNKHNCDQIPPGGRARFVTNMPIPGQQPQYSPTVGYARTTQYPTIHSPEFPTVQYTAQPTPVWNASIPIAMSETYQISNQHSYPPQQQMYNTETPHMMTIPTNAYIPQVQNQTEFDPITNVCLCSKCGFLNTLAHIQLKRLSDENKRLHEQLSAMEHQQNSNYEEGARSSPALQATVPVSSLSVDAQPFQMGGTQGLKILQGTNVSTETTTEANNRQHNPNGNDYSHHTTRNWQAQGNTPVVSASHVTNDQYNESTTSDPEWSNVPDNSHQEIVNEDTSCQQETDCTVETETPSVSANEEWDMCESTQQESNVILTSAGPFVKLEKQDDESSIDSALANSAVWYTGKDDRNATENQKSRPPKEQRPRQNRNRGSRNEVYDNNRESEGRRNNGRRGSGGYSPQSPQDQKERRLEKSVCDSRDSSQSRLRSGSEHFDRKECNSGDGVKGNDSTERSSQEKRLDSTVRTYSSQNRFDSGEKSSGRRTGANSRRFNDQGGTSKGHESPSTNWRQQDMSDGREDRRDYRSGNRAGSSGPRRSNPSTFKVVTDKEGDLFNAPDDHSLAHCVAEDLRMGSGIAVRFRQLFKGVEELCDQKKHVGEVAVLEDKDRYIFYLITKKLSSGKPLWVDFVAAVEDLKRECIEKGVKNLSMPRMGCGLDRLEWQSVKRLLETTFTETCINITAYNFQQNDEAESPASKLKSMLYIMNVRKDLADIDAETGLLFLCSEDPNTSDRTIESLHKKHNLLTELRGMKRNVGEVVTIKRGREYLYGLVVKKSDSDPLSYVNLGKCLRKMRNTNSKEQYGFFGMEAFRDGKDTITMEKVITCVRNVFSRIQYKLEFYICWPKDLESDHAWDDQNTPNAMPSSK